MNWSLYTYEEIHVEREEGERLLTPCNRENTMSVNRVVIPEGVEEIAGGAFSLLQKLERVELPKSLKILGNGLFRGIRGRVQITYRGSSEAFIAMARPQVTEVYVPGSFDHYPYYSDHGASFREEVKAFDTDCEEIAVHCAEDGVSIYYGSKYKKPNAPEPMSHAEWTELQERERRWRLAKHQRVHEFLQQAESITLICGYEGPHAWPCFGTHLLLNGRIYLAVRNVGSLYAYVSKNCPFMLQAVSGTEWVNAEGKVCWEEDETVLKAFSEAFPAIKEKKHGVISFEEGLLVLRYGKAPVCCW